MGKLVDSDKLSRTGETAALQIRLLGSLQVSRMGKALPLPPSRKARALLAYLALAPQGILRSQLCELLWELPNDPKGELRWCLSKLRGILDDPARHRVDTPADTIRLDLTDCFVDAREMAGAMRTPVEALTHDRLQMLSDLFAGDFLEGLEIGRSPLFDNWLAAQRRRFRGWQVAILEQLARQASGDAIFSYLDRWLQLAPFDLGAHELLLNALVRMGRIREGEEHLAAAARLFEADDIDFAPVIRLWQAARTRSEPVPQFRAAGPDPAATDAPETAPAVRRASIAVMPFDDQTPVQSGPGGAADGLASDVITRLAKLRSLFVIAQGSTFALRERRVAPGEAGRMLNVDYVVSGTLRRHDGRLTVTVELAETRTARIAWAERFDRTVDDAFLVLDEIGDRIVASVDHEIEMIERNRAVLRPPSSLDAWEAHHRGLWHMYRFSRSDNEQARHFFETAVRLDPTFARAYAGLSFTHFQNAFQGWTDRGPEMYRALEAAGQSLMADDRDPAAHYAMGRALWLRGDQDRSVAELGQAVELSPNFALGHYALAFVHSQAGDARSAIQSSEHSSQLSPFDPLLFGMFGARAMALVRMRQFGEAADWGVRAAARPNAHVHIQAIAAYSLALADRFDEARTHMAMIRRAQPGYQVGDFLTAMRFDQEGAALFREGEKRLRT